MLELNSPIEPDIIHRCWNHWQKDLRTDNVYIRNQDASGMIWFRLDEGLHIGLFGLTKYDWLYDLGITNAAQSHEDSPTRRVYNTLIQ